MLKLAMLCALGCGSSVTAMAGERGDAPNGIRQLPSAMSAAHVVAHARSAHVAAAAHLPAAPVVAHPVTTFVMPERVKAMHYDIAAPRDAERVVSDVAARAIATPTFAGTDSRVPADWRLAGALPEVTASAGARYAVGETLADHRRVGPPRSPLDAMLVLKIDGSNPVPALSVGGGVAGAMWKAGVNR